MIQRVYWALINARTSDHLYKEFTWSVSADYLHMIYTVCRISYSSSHIIYIYIFFKHCLFTGLNKKKTLDQSFEPQCMYCIFSYSNIEQWFHQIIIRKSHLDSLHLIHRTICAFLGSNLIFSETNQGLCLLESAP